MHAAGGIDRVEAQLRAAVHLDAELRGGTGEGGRLAEHDAAVELGQRGHGHGGAGSSQAREDGAAFHESVPM